ncbi:MAG: hypothetical protein ACI4U4_00185 [Bacilli bacterium]
MDDNEYMGKEIATFTDANDLIEPVTSALDDIDRSSITELYSLGDNIGLGLNPGEVIGLL